MDSVICQKITNFAGYGHDISLRCRCGRCRPRRLRSSLCSCAHGCSHCHHHNGHEQNSTDELQSCRGWDCQRSDCARSRCTRRTNGLSDRCHSHTIPHAKPIKRPRYVESACTMRSHSLHRRMASSHRKHRKPRCMARRSQRAYR